MVGCGGHGGVAPGGGVGVGGRFPHPLIVTLCYVGRGGAGVAGADVAAEWLMERVLASRELTECVGQRSFFGGDMGLPGRIALGALPAGQMGGAVCGGAFRGARGASSWRGVVVSVGVGSRCVAQEAGEAGGADALVLFVGDDDFVGGGGAAAVDGGGDAGDEAVAGAAVVGAVEVDADGDLGGAAVEQEPTEPRVSARTAEAPPWRSP